MPRSETPPSVVRFLKPSVLEGYVGNYQFGTNRQFEITLKSDQLYAKITGQSPWPVFAEGPADHFVYDVVDASLSFQRDADGTIKGLVLHQDGENRPLAIRIK